jgi:hypothetical protein
MYCILESVPEVCFDMNYKPLKYKVMRIELIIVGKRIAGYKVIAENALPRIVFFGNGEGQRA